MIKSNEKWGSPCSFWRHNADKCGYLVSFGKNPLQPKTRQKGEIFWMTHVVSHRIWIECIVYPPTYQKNAFSCSCFYFNLRSKVDLILTSDIRPIIAQFSQFSKIVKKLNVDSCQFFSHWKEAPFLLKSWNKKWRSPYSFLTQSCRKCAPPAFSPFFERGLGRVSKWHEYGRGRKH